MTAANPFERVCPRCGKQALLVKIHDDRGGPELCMDCGWELRRQARDQARSWAAVFSGLGVPGAPAGPGEFTVELLTDAISLTHPDRHPPELAEKATRVTAELTALRPWARPKPKPTPRDGSITVPHVTLKEPSRQYPCESCIFMSPNWYCDACRQRWEADQRAEREQRNALQRQRYRRRKRREWRRHSCEQCGTTFKPARADARHCSNACRQKAYRARKAAS